jgi:diadenosine tetraphosphate (Ap4A) HIT family hydrolase
MSDVSCECCSIYATAAEGGTGIALGPYWTCNIRVGHHRPALVVQTTRHCSDLDQLSTDELRALGNVLQVVSGAVTEAGPVERVYVQLFNEVRPGHVHFHIVPRFTLDSQVGPFLLDSADHASTFDALHALALAAERVPTERAEPSAVIRGILHLCNLWNYGPSMYGKMPNIGKLDRAESYIVMWLTLWTSALAASWFFENWALTIVVSLLWSYRLIDLVLYEIGILLNAAPTSLISIPRALALRVANLVEVFLTTSALLLASPGLPSSSAAVRQGYALTALQPEFEQPGVFTDIILAVNWVAVLVILTGGIAMLIGKIGETFSESAS